MQAFDPLPEPVHLIIHLGANGVPAWGGFHRVMQGKTRIKPAVVHGQFLTARVDGPVGGAFADPAGRPFDAVGQEHLPGGLAPDDAPLADAMLVGEENMDYAGYAVAAGDVDGDGIPWRTLPGTHPSKGAFFTRGTSRNPQAMYSEANLEVDAELNAFKAGGVGIVWNGIWQTTNVTGAGVEFDGRATAVPQIGPQMAVWAGSHQLTLPSQGTIDPCKDEAAGIFIKYILENSVTWAQAGQIPASAAVRASAEFQAIEPQASIGTSVEYAVFPPSIPGITDAFGPLGEAVGALMNGTATDIQATLDDAATRANEIIAQNAASVTTKLQQMASGFVYNRESMDHAYKWLIAQPPQVLTPVM